MGVARVTPSEEVVHISPMKAAPKLGKAALDTWRSPVCLTTGWIKPA
jgi:hypothetical protein